MKNPLRDYPSSMSLFGMETDGTLLNLPIFPASGGGGKGQKPGSRGDQTFKRGVNDPATCVLEAITARRDSGASLTFCTWKDDSTHPEVIRPFSDSNDAFSCVCSLFACCESLCAIFFVFNKPPKDGEMGNVYWIPGVMNPADGLTRLRSEMGPLLTLFAQVDFSRAFYVLSQAWHPASCGAYSLSL